VGVISSTIVSTLRHFLTEGKFLLVAKEVSGRGPKIGRGWKEITYVHGFK
jgi:hypothetical protein